MAAGQLSSSWTPRLSAILLTLLKYDTTWLPSMTSRADKPASWSRCTSARSTSRGEIVSAIAYSGRR